MYTYVYVYKRVYIDIWNNWEICKGWTLFKLLSGTDIIKENSQTNIYGIE